MKHQSYFTRALKAKDPRFARIFAKMGYQTTDLVADDQGDDLSDLRKLYQKVVGKKAYHGWDADTLKDKIAAAE